MKQAVKATASKTLGNVERNLLKIVVNLPSRITVGFTLFRFALIDTFFLRFNLMETLKAFESDPSVDERLMATI